MKSFETLDHTTINRMSRWIRVRTDYDISPRHSLYDYAFDENGYGPYSDKFSPEHGVSVDYFIYNGRKYALERFIRLGSPWACPVMFYDETGKLNYLSGYDSEDYYNPIMIELDECGEFVRVYQEARNP